MVEFEKKCLNFIRDNALIKAGDRIVIGLSGGADSVSLLLALFSLSGELGLDKESLIAVHVNHMLRGEEADMDEQFSKELCDGLGIRFYSEHIDIQELSDRLHISCEEAGRKGRYETFDKVAELEKCTLIAVAHNQNDLAETFLFNLIRGSGIEGASGISAKRDNIIRPVLFASRKDIEEYLLEKKQGYCTDSTNKTLDYDRNKIRNVIIPELVRINSRAQEHLVTFANEANSVNLHLDKLADEFIDTKVDKTGTGVTFKESDIGKLDDVMASYVVKKLICTVAGKSRDITRRHVLSVLGLMEKATGSRVNLPYSIVAGKNYNYIFIEKKDVRNDVKEEQIGCVFLTEGVNILPGGKRVKLEVIDAVPGMDIAKNVYTKMVDYGKIRGDICIRNPKDGDYIVISGQGNKKKLNRLFIDSKIDRDKRLTWPVICDESGVIWVVGLRYSEQYKIDKDTKKVLQITYEER